MMRTLLPLTLFVVSACGGGGGGAPAAQASPNPAPELQPTTTIDMTGTWRVTNREIVEANTTETNGLNLDSYVQFAGGQVVQADVPGVGPVPVWRSTLEAATGFALDWYENAGDGSSADFGYGWDRLRVAGGGGAFRDYVQYGIRLVAVSPNLMVGYEAEVTQDYLGQPRFDYLASLILSRVGP